jgi:hypothetical protein
MSSASNGRRQYHMVFILDVDDAAAAALPGDPGWVNPTDPTDSDPPVDGMTLSMDTVMSQILTVIYENFHPSLDVVVPAATYDQVIDLNTGENSDHA